MKEYITQTIRDLDFEISRLSTIRDGLREQFGQEPSPVLNLCGAVMTTQSPPTGSNGNAKASAPSAKPKPAKVPAGSPQGVTGASRAANSTRMVQAAEGLRSFTSAELCAAAGSDRSNAMNYMLRWKRWGWVTVKDGRYTKAEKWGQMPKRQSSAPGAKRPAPIASPAAEHTRPISHDALAAQLEAALKQRDAARSAGRDTMVDMFQQDVDRITRLMGGAAQ